MVWDPKTGTHDLSLHDAFYNSRLVINKDTKVAENVDVKKFNLLPTWEDVVLEEGEIIVTANWWHQAFNTLEGFSVSGSTVNNANIQRVLLDMFRGGPKRNDLDPTHAKNACSLLQHGTMIYGSKWRDTLLTKLDNVARSKQDRLLDHFIQTLKDDCGQAPLKELLATIVHELGDLDGPYRKWIGWGLPIREQDLPPVYPEVGSAEPAMKIAIENARAKTSVDGRRRFVLLQIGRSTCKWCRMIKDFLHNNPRVKEVLDQEFEIVLVNNKILENKKMMKEEVAPNLKHAPWLVILEASNLEDERLAVGEELTKEKGEKKKQEEEKEKESSVLKRIGAVSLGSFPSDVLEKGMGYDPSRVLNFLSSGHTYKMDGKRVVRDSLNWRESSNKNDQNEDDSKDEL
jgi:hypothetical protein